MSLRFLLLFSLSILAGCDQQAIMDKFAPQQDVKVAKNYIDELKQGNFSDIKANLDPAIAGGDINATLVKMAAAIPGGAPLDVKIVGAGSMNTDGVPMINITFEYAYPGNKWVLANVAVQKKDGRSSIVGFNVYQVPDSIEHLNRFTLAGKGVVTYVMLALLMGVVVSIIFALYRCIKTPGVKRRWLWVLFILLGIGKFTLNWTTGQVSVTPIAVQLFGAGAFRGLYAPWMVSISVPLGAILFLIRYRRGRREEPATLQDPDTPAGV